MARNNRVAVQGDITGDIYYDILQLANKPLPFLRVYMMINGSRGSKEVKGLRVVFYGILAELAEAHLQKGSRIEVEGHLQIRQVKNEGIVVEVVGEDVDFIRNVDWEKGRKRYQEMVAAGKIQQAQEEDVVSAGVVPVESWA
jgi:single-stranded DNA-binding protein